MADPTAELAQATAWLEWSANPCGKPPLVLSEIPRFAEYREGRCLAISLDTTSVRVPAERAPALTQLEAAWHFRRDFPGEIAGYYEGEHPEEPSDWVIILYGKGDAWPVRPEPPKPEFMR